MTKPKIAVNMKVDESGAGFQVFQNIVYHLLITIISFFLKVMDYL